MPITLTTTDPDFEARFHDMLGAKREDSTDVNDVVASIIAEVRARGDAALVDYTARFDRLTLTPATLAFSPEEIAAEIERVSPEDRAAFVRVSELMAEMLRG